MNIYIVKKRSKGKNAISSKSKKVIPVWIKVISACYFIGASLNIIAGIGLLFLGNMFGMPLDDFGIYMTLAMLTVVGLFIIALGVFYIFVGKDLWKGKNWAKITAIVVSFLSVLAYLISFIFGSFGSIILVIIHSLIVWYLLFNKNAKKAFS